MTVERGTTAGTLLPHASVASLPFVDDPGSLTDPLLPLLFYRVPEAENDLSVTKDLTAEAVRLSFR